MRIALISKPGHSDSGVGRYVDHLAPALVAAGHEVILVNPTIPLPKWLMKGVKKLLGWDLQAFLSTYPIWATYPPADIYHITSQNLATLLFFRPPSGKTVITVHDIIPWEVQANPELKIYRHKFQAIFDRLALAGIRRCRTIITDSDYSARSLRMVFPELGAEVRTIYLASE